MFVLLLAALLHYPTPPEETLPDTAPVYTSVLTDLHLRAGAQWSNRRILLDESVQISASARGERERQWHPIELLKRLEATEWVDGLCDTNVSTYVCQSAMPGDVVVTLGDVKILPPASTVRPDAPPLAPVAEPLPAEFAVDVTLYSPCPDCRNVNLVGYRYFLKRDCAGRYIVVTRWQTDAA